MRIPQNLQKHFNIIEAQGIDLEELFRVGEMPSKERFLRRYAAPIAGLMPTNIRYRLTDLAKRFRNPSRELNLNYPLDFPECQVIARQLEKLDISPWWGKRAVICLCHDVDNKRGYDFLWNLLEINCAHDLPATFNFLTHDEYPLDKNLLFEIVQNGSEVGLHGYNHDQGFAFRHPQTIRTKLREAIEALEGFSIRGFRSAALSISDPLFTTLGESDIHYDSSLQISSPFYNSVKIPYPFYMERYQIWEIPLMVQDDNYFRDTQTPSDVIFRSLDRFIKEIKALNGVFVINMHPHLMVKHQDFYQQFVKHLKRYDEVAFATIQDVIRYAQSYDHNQQ